MYFSWKLFSILKSFSRHLLERGWTPLFEFCSFSNQIVLEYPEDTFLLTAVRHNYTGVYFTWPQLQRVAEFWTIPTVQAHLVDTTKHKEVHSLLDDVKQRSNIEGYDVSFAYVSSNGYIALYFALRMEKCISSRRTGTLP